MRLLPIVVSTVLISCVAVANAAPVKFSDQCDPRDSSRYSDANTSIIYDRKHTHQFGVDLTGCEKEGVCEIVCTVKKPEHAQSFGWNNNAYTTYRVFEEYSDGRIIYGYADGAKPMPTQCIDVAAEEGDTVSVSCDIRKTDIDADDIHEDFS